MDARRIASPVLLVLAGVALLLGTLALYAHRTVFDSDDFSRRAASTLEDPEVRAVIGARVADAAIDARPNLIGARPLIESAAGGIAGAAPFRALFAKGVRDVHRALFDRDRPSVTLKVADIGLLVVEALRQVAPGVARRIPDDLTADLVAVSGDDPDGLAADLGRVADDVRWLGTALPLLAIALLAGAVAVALERRAAFRRAGLTVAAVGVLVVVAWVVGRGLVVGQFEGDESRAAARAVWDAFLLDLRTWSLVLAGAGVVVAATASSLLRPVDLRPALGRAWATISATPRRPALRGLRAVALLAAGILVIVQREAVLHLLVLAAGLFLLYTGLTEVLRLTVGDRPLGDRKARRAGLPSPGRVAAVVAIAGAVVLGGVLVANAADETEPAALEIRECNGHAALCDRRLDDVSMLATHNSMSAATYPGWLFAQQEKGIAQQLDAGVRGLLIDTHQGVRTPRGVYTILAEASKSRGKLVAELGERFVARAERLRKDIGYRGGGDPKTFLCHGFCEPGAILAHDALGEVRDFLVANPHEVVVISVEDDAPPPDTERAFRESELIDYVWMDPIEPFPTLREMIEADRRVLVMAEDDTGGIPWLRPQFRISFETPFKFKDLAALAAPESCEPNRGQPANPLFLLNHWVDTSPAPLPSNAQKANAYDFLLERARRCERERERLPNLVAIDFYAEGDGRRVVDALNRVGQ